MFSTFFGTKKYQQSTYGVQAEVEVNPNLLKEYSLSLFEVHLIAFDIC